MHLKSYCLIISFTGISPKQHIRVEEIQIYKSAHYNILCAKLLQLCLTLCDPMDCNFYAQGILQSKILEWVAMLSSGGSSQPEPRD